MAVDTLTKGMPPEHDLSGGYTIRVDAIDASSGATVTGVNVSNVIITARNLLTGAIERIQPLGPPPLFAYASESTVGAGGGGGGDTSSWPGYMGGTIYWWGYVDTAQGNGLGPRAGELNGYGGVVVSADGAAGTYMVEFPDHSSDSFPLPRS